MGKGVGRAGYKRINKNELFIPLSRIARAKRTFMGVRYIGISATTDLLCVFHFGEWLFIRIVLNKVWMLLLHNDYRKISNKRPPPNKRPPLSFYQLPITKK